MAGTRKTGGYRALIMAACILLTVLVTGSEARASAKEHAAALFNEAAKLFDRGMYLDALKKFRKARAVYPSFKIDLNIGATLDAMGRRTEAAGYFEKFLINAAKAPPPIIAAARQRLEQLRKKLARIKVTCLVEGAMVRVGDKSVGLTPLELPIYLEPGSYVINVSKQGYRTGTVTLALRAGQFRDVDLPVERAAAPASRPAATSRPAPAPPVEAKPASQPAPAPATGAEELARQRKRKTTAGYVLLGVGAAVTVTAAVFIGMGVSKGNEAYDEYMAAGDQRDIDVHWADVETGRELVYTGLSAAGVSLVLYGIGAYMLATRPSAEAASSPGPAPVSLQPRRGGAVLSLGGSF